jgi:acetone carboxylase gamma subunit
MIPILEPSQQNEGKPLTNSCAVKCKAVWVRRCIPSVHLAAENYKLHCAVTERPLKAIKPHLLDPKTYVGDKIVFRSYACPSCGLLIQTELAHPTDPPLWDIQLAV